MKKIIVVLIIICISLILFNNNKSNIKSHEFTFDNWHPNDIFEKKITVSNDYDYNTVIRVSLKEEWSNNLTGDIDQNYHATTITFDDNWKLVNGYYYYKYYLKPNEETSSLIKSIKFSSMLNDDDNYYGYKNNIYKIKYRIETIKYEKDNPWNINIKKFKMKPITASDFINLSNKQKIKKYNEGNVHTMYTFSHEETELTPFLTLDYRFIGNDPYNYVEFNDELWRIIGVFDVEDELDNVLKRFKIVRIDSIDNQEYDTINNNWSYSSLNKYLNINYYHTLNDLSKEMIADTKYYLGSIDPNITNTENIYIKERSIQNLHKQDWIGKISLPYPSDFYYTFGLNYNNNCFNKLKKCNNSWMNINNNWFLNSINDINKASNLNNNKLESSDIFNKLNIYPVLYLKENVQIVEGNGSIEQPYKLKYNKYGEYKVYYQGEKIKFDNDYYYVIENSDSNKSYVKLLKEKPLTNDEINNYSNNYKSINGEYPYFENNNCNTNYDDSSIKNIIDKWSYKYDNQLISINGYRARLITDEEIINNLNYQLDDIIINNKPYFIMKDNEVYSINEVLKEEEYNKLYIRPVIIVKKCALTGICL